LSVRDPVTIPQRFEVRKRIGTGSQRTVWLADDRESGRPVALSEIPSAADAGVVDGHRTLAWIQRASRDRHVAPVYEVLEQPDGVLIVAEYFEGGDLRAWIDRGMISAGDDREALRMASQIARALDYAHSAGVVHGDVSPGNILLDIDGNAFLADFGFASRDDDRSVTAGAGTPPYMAPEKARGDAGSVESDLYSLGCVLFELLTGRPPFEGADRDAILLRHQLEQPKLPSRILNRSNALLDSLVMDLLEKRPEARPQHALDVSIALEALRRRGVTRDTRSECVGRARAVGLLERAVEIGIGGKATSFLVQGDAGVGKTSLVNRLCDDVEAAGGRVLVAACGEDERIPFGPLTDAIRPAIAGLGRLEDAAARELISVMRGDVSVPRDASVSDIDRVHHPVERGLAVALRSVLEQGSVVLLVDDLHWADASTLRFLVTLVESIAAGVAGLPGLVLLMTTRPVGVDAPHVGAVERIAESASDRLVLEGLARTELADLVRSVIGAEPAPDLVEWLNDVTAGNPLFARTVLAHLRDEEILATRNGRVVTPREPSSLDVPATIHPAIERRIRSLGSAASRDLAQLACLGESIDPAEVAEALTGEPCAFDETIRMGIAQQVLVDTPGEIQFAHPLIRTVLRSSLAKSEREALHACFAGWLEASPDESPRRLHRLAFHGHSAGQLVAASQRVQWATEAGLISLGLSAWQDAAVQFENAISALSHSSEGSRLERARLHRLVGLALYYAFDADRCLEHLNLAVEHSEGAGDPELSALALNDRFRAMGQFGIVPMGDSTQIGALEQALKQLGRGCDATRARLQTSLSVAYWHSERPIQANRYSELAVETSMRMDDSRLCGEALIQRAVAQLSNLQIVEALSSLREGEVHADRENDALLQTQAVNRLPLALVSLGRIEEAAAAAKRAVETSDAIQVPGEASLGHALCAVVAAIQGDYERVEANAARSRQIGERAPYPWPASLYLPALAYAQFLRGEWSAANRTIELLSTPGEIFEGGQEWADSVRRQQAWIAYHCGERVPTEDEAALAEWEVPADPKAFSFAAIPAMCCHVELAAAIGVASDPRVEPALEAAWRRGVSVSIGWPHLVARARGLVELERGRIESAVDCFEQNLAVAERLASPFETARAHLDLADALVRRGGRALLLRARSEVELALPHFDATSIDHFQDRAARLERYVRERL